MIAAMIRGITSFIKDTIQTHNNEKPQKTEVIDSEEKKNLSSGGGNSFSSLIQTANRLEAQDKERSQMISEEDCRKRMKHDSGFVAFLFYGSIVALLLYFFS
jgi:hypothetical protein